MKILIILTKPRNLLTKEEPYQTVELLEKLYPKEGLLKEGLMWKEKFHQMEELKIKKEDRNPY